MNVKVIFCILFLFLFFKGFALMAGEGQSNYLTNKEIVEKIYSLLQSEDLDSAKAHMFSFGDDKTVVNTWIGLQCDINNIKGDPYLSAEFAEAGIAYCSEKGYKMPAAMMLHNISAFFMPNWDENVDSAAVPIALDAARRQVPIRKEIGQEGPLLWAYWDLGLAELVAGNADEAIASFNAGVEIAEKTGDKDGGAWCKLFIGKTKIKHFPDKKEAGEKEMLEAARTIMEIGQDWEKESIPGILKTVGLKL